MIGNKLIFIAIKYCSLLQTKCNHTRSFCSHVSCAHSDGTKTGSERVIQHQESGSLRSSQPWWQMGVLKLLDTIGRQNCLQCPRNALMMLWYAIICLFSFAIITNNLFEKETCDDFLRQKVFECYFSRTEFVDKVDVPSFIWRCIERSKFREIWESKINNRCKR